MIKKINFPKLYIILFSVAFLLVFGSITHVNAESNIKLIVDGNDITYLSSPILENDRTLVPIRFISEEIGAIVTWDGENRTVLVQKDNKSVFLKIDKRLIDYNNGSFFQLSDVAPMIINDRTYVPLRLISNALGLGIEWDGETRTVYVDSSKSSQIESFFAVSYTHL